MSFLCGGYSCRVFDTVIRANAKAVPHSWPIVSPGPIPRLSNYANVNLCRRFKTFTIVPVRFPIRLPQETKQNVIYEAIRLTDTRRIPAEEPVRFNSASDAMDGNGMVRHGLVKRYLKQLIGSKINKSVEFNRVQKARTHSAKRKASPASWSVPDTQVESQSRTILAVCALAGVGAGARAELPLGSTPPRCSQKDQQMKISMGWPSWPGWLLLV